MLDCWYEYHNTIFGLAITVNIALNTPGPIPCPLSVDDGTLTKGTIVNQWIENPATWPAEFHQFWWDGEIFYQYYTTPTTRYHLTIQPDANGDVEFNVAAPYCCVERYHVPCAADFNLNGFVDGDDSDAYFVKFTQGCEQADFDDNGFVNGDDFDLFAQRFTEGC